MKIFLNLPLNRGPILKKLKKIRKPCKFEPIFKARHRKSHTDQYIHSNNDYEELYESCE